MTRKQLLLLVIRNLKGILKAWECYIRQDETENDTAAQSDS